MSNHDRISEEAAQAIWRRAAQLQAEAERRLDEQRRRVAPKRLTSSPPGDGLHPDDVRTAAEEAGISPEFVQIALAEASAAGEISSAMARRDLLGAKIFLETCEVLVAGDLHAGMRTRWRWSAATAVGATTVGGALGIGMAGSALGGALLALPTVLGATAVSGIAVGVLALGYRYYRRALEKSLEESLHLLPATVRAVTSSRGGSEVGRRHKALPTK